jgi:putative DNA primase/helicase
MIEETTPAIIATNIPKQLKRRPQWVCWRYEERDGKMTKIPYTPETGALASTADLMTWRTFEGALQCLEDEEARTELKLPAYDGVGFVFSSGDPYAGIDLDGCRDPETSEIEPWAQKVIDRVQAGYIEVSPSGRGVHIIVEGEVRGGGMRKGSIEMYSQRRFFTITGVML